jgi:hypothetical protein
VQPSIPQASDFHPQAQRKSPLFYPLCFCRQILFLCALPWTLLLKVVNVFSGLTFAQFLVFFFLPLFFGGLAIFCFWLTSFGLFAFQVFFVSLFLFLEKLLESFRRLVVLLAHEKLLINLLVQSAIPQK